MSFKNPEEILSPRGRIKDLEVLEKNEYYSIALLKWDDKDVIGVRWNGDENSVGIPQSRGVPTWFILPDEISELYVEKYFKKIKEKEIVSERLKNILSKK